MKKTALVTGVAGGIGFATAEKLLENGVAVVGMDILPEMPKELKLIITYQYIQIYLVKMKK